MAARPSRYLLPGWAGRMWRSCCSAWPCWRLLSRSVRPGRSGRPTEVIRAPDTARSRSSVRLFRGGSGAASVTRRSRVEAVPARAPGRPDKDCLRPRRVGSAPAEERATDGLRHGLVWPRSPAAQDDDDRHQADCDERRGNRPVGRMGIPARLRIRTRRTALLEVPRLRQAAAPRAVATDGTDGDADRGEQKHHGRDRKDSAHDHLDVTVRRFGSRRAPRRVPWPGLGRSGIFDPAYSSGGA
jgi:hypothetical protein